VSGADLATVAGVALAVVAVGGGLVAFGKWIYNRGADDKQLSLELKNNTQATKDLTASFHRVLDMQNQQGVTLHDHGRRLDGHDQQIAELKAR
jgi:hypothetical protein